MTTQIRKTLYKNRYLGKTDHINLSNLLQKYSNLSLKGKNLHLTQTFSKTQNHPFSEVLSCLLILSCIVVKFWHYLELKGYQWKPRLHSLIQFLNLGPKKDLV